MCSEQQKIQSKRYWNPLNHKKLPLKTLDTLTKYMQKYVSDKLHLKENVGLICETNDKANTMLGFGTDPTGSFWVSFSGFDMILFHP